MTSSKIECENQKIPEQEHFSFCLFDLPIPLLATMTQKQCTLFVDFYIQPSRTEEFKAAHRPVWAACGNEPECLLFDVFQDPLDPGICSYTI